MSPTLETPRLRLRPLTPSDEADLVALDSDPEVMRYVGSPAGVKSPAETRERARLRIREEQRGAYEPLGFWRIEGRSDGAFHGVGALIRMPDGDDVEVAYRLARSAWGRGIATEAAGALVAHALGPLALAPGGGRDVSGEPGLAAGAGQARLRAPRGPGIQGREGDLPRAGRLRLGRARGWRFCSLTLSRPHRHT